MAPGVTGLSAHPCDFAWSPPSLGLSILAGQQSGSKLGGPRASWHGAGCKQRGPLCCLWPSPLDHPYPLGQQLDSLTRRGPPPPRPSHRSALGLRPGLCRGLFQPCLSPSCVLASPLSLPRHMLCSLDVTWKPSLMPLLGVRGPAKLRVQGSRFQRWGAWLTLGALGPSKQLGTEGLGRVTSCPSAPQTTPHPLSFTPTLCLPQPQTLAPAIPSTWSFSLSRHSLSLPESCRCSDTQHQGDPSGSLSSLKPA